MAQFVTRSSVHPQAHHHSWVRFPMADAQFGGEAEQCRICHRFRAYTFYGLRVYAPLTGYYYPGFMPAVPDPIEVAGA